MLKIKDFALQLMRKLPVLALVCAAFFGPALPGGAEEPHLTVSLDKQTAEVNEEIHLNVKIAGARGSLQAPRLPSLEGFEIFYSGRASHFSFVNGRTESMTEFSYVLVPRQAGRFVLQPIEISVEGKVYRTDQLEIRIEPDQFAQAQTPVSTRPLTPAPLPPASYQPPAQGSFPPPAPQPVSAPRDALDERIFLKVSPSHYTVYTNQQLVLTYSLYTALDTRYEGFEEEPETTGFWVEEFPMDQNLGRDTEVVGGRKYVRADVKKLALFPTSAGQYTIKPGVIKTSVQIEQRSSSLFDEFFNDPFFSGGGLFTRRVEKRLSAPPIQVLVKPLPEEGKSASFKGAVGDFRMGTAVDKRVVDQNQAVTLRVTLEGEGNVETLVRPEIPEIPAARVYDSDTQSQLYRQQNVIAGKKTFEVILIPQEAGELPIPSLEFSFFNPKIERYVVLKSDPYPIKVNPSLVPPPQAPKEIASAQIPESKKAVRAESEDIRYIKQKIYSSRRLPAEALLFWFALANGALTIAGAGLWISRKRREFLELNVPLKRRLLARKAAKQGLKQLERLSQASRSDAQARKEFFEEYARILNQYLSDKLNLSAQGWTQGMLESHLEARKAGPEIIQKIRESNELCDHVRFGGSEVRSDDFSSMIKNLHEIIEALERKR